MDSDIKLQDGTAEVIGDKFKTSVGDLELLYRGGRLTTSGGNIDLSGLPAA